MWPFNTVDCLIKVTTWTVLTVSLRCYLIIELCSSMLLFKLYNYIHWSYKCLFNIQRIKKWWNLWISIHVNLQAGAFFSRFWGSLPSTFKIFRPWKKSSTIKSWPTFCDQYFRNFSIWNSCADEKRWEIRMVKVNVIFNDIRLLICLTPLQVNWVMVIN